MKNSLEEILQSEISSSSSVNALGLHEVPDSDGTVSESTEKSSTLGIPFKRSTFLKEGTFKLSLSHILGGLMLEHSERFKGLVVLEIPDENATVSGGGEPLVGWVELESVDLSLGLELDGGLLEVVDVPDIDEAVFASGGDVLASWCDGQCVDGTLVSSEGVLDLEVLAPDLEESVPTDSGEVLALV